MKVLITGASRGIGRALCLEGLRRGHEVHAVVRDAAKAPEGTSAHILKDVRDREATASLLKKVAPDMDLFIANAGVGHDLNPKNENSAELAAEILDVNTTAVIYSSYRMAYEWIQGGHKNRRVAMVASLAAGRGLPRSSVYCASKAALVSFAQGFEIDLLRNQIGVSVVCPGFIETEMSADLPVRPFLISVEKCARLTWDGLERKRFMIAFPRAMAIISWLRDHIPYFLFRWSMKMAFPASKKSSQKEVTQQ